MKDTHLSLKTLVVGALIGAVPVLLGTYLQARYAARQTVTDQRAQTIKDFSRACNKFVFDFADGLASLRRLRTIGLTDANVAAVVDEAKPLMLNLSADAVELQAITDFANAIFGTTLPPVPVPQLLSSRTSQLNGPSTVIDLLDQTVAEGSKTISGVKAACQSRTQMLASKINE